MVCVYHTGTKISISCKIATLALTCTHAHIHAHFIFYLREHVLYLAQKRFLKKWLTLSCPFVHSIACALNDMQCCTHTVWSWLYHELVFCEPVSVYNHFLSECV